MGALTWEIREGDALEQLAELAAESVQCVITSPPYYGLRDYGTGEWEGGDPECDHKRSVSLTASSGLRRDGREHAGPYEGEKAIEASARPYMSECRRCGARRSDRQIGLEPTPEEYVERLVAVFREVRRVLRGDGVVWLNLGDSYAGSWGAQSRGQAESSVLSPSTMSAQQIAAHPRGQSHTGSIPAGADYKAKDLLMVPALVALALRADGWWLRSDIIWAKPNPMPESVADRPTGAHEHVFLLAKSARYFYDADAIREPHAVPLHAPGNRVRPEMHAGPMDRGGASQWQRDMSETWGNPSGRNKRNVWEIATQPFPEAHFATFPPELIVPCVLAGSSPQACGECGAPRRRVTEREDQGYDGSRYGERAVAATGGATSGGTERSTLGSSNGTKTGQQRTLGWEPTCAHALEADVSDRCTVLDPFAGSGTVGVVCEWYGRDFIGLELSPAYAEMARRRIESEGRLGRPASRPRETDGDQLALL